MLTDRPPVAPFGLLVVPTVDEPERSARLKHDAVRLANPDDFLNEGLAVLHNVRIGRTKRVRIPIAEGIDNGQVGVLITQSA
ncbi:hypothetical protein ACFQ1S_24000 [Kibdelosporangium lantanae]|uniref:Uncharacterized protein n=1 Tax=Kibdelosporangium lantanae TaxID=1497396 RepID=A0ABW3MCL3_9PSEU